MSFDLRTISLGAGVQSSALYLMACAGEIPGPKPDYAIFADTQAEPPHVYEQLEYLKRVGNIPIIVGTAGDLGKAVKAGTASRTSSKFGEVPFWVSVGGASAGPGRRQCTFNYKINVVYKETRKLLGLADGERAAGRFKVEEWVGISTDEASRAKDSRTSWITTRWPLLYDVPMNRVDCRIWLEKNGHPMPEKSACIFCPYRSPAEYARWKREKPELFEAACKVDDLIRSSGSGDKKQFILNKLYPLRELDAENTDQMDLFDEECEGMCGV